MKYGSIIAIALAVASVPVAAGPPTDFDSFWSEHLSRLDHVPIKATLSKVEITAPAITLSSVTIDSLNSKARGYLAFPNDNGKHPALLIFLAAQVSPLDRNIPTQYARQGWIAFLVSPHDGPLDNRAVPSNFYLSGNAAPETSYFLNMILRDMRALEYVRTLPNWDGHTIVVMGGSMGGQQALITASLGYKYVTAVLASRPAFADGRTGFPYWDVRQPDIAKTIEYFSVINFARHIQASTLISIADHDDVALPAGIWAVFNRISAPKEAIFLPNSDHAGTNSLESNIYDQRQKAVLDELLRTGAFVPSSQ